MFASSEPQDPEAGDPEEEASSQDFLIEEPDSQESFSSMDVDGAGEASSQDTLSGQPDSQGSFSSMDLDEEGEAEGGPAPDEAGETKEGDGQSRGAGGPESACCHPKGRHDGVLTRGRASAAEEVRKSTNYAG